MFFLLPLQSVRVLFLFLACFFWLDASVQLLLKVARPDNLVVVLFLEGEHCFSYDASCGFFVGPLYQVKVVLFISKLLMHFCFALFCFGFALLHWLQLGLPFSWSHGENIQSSAIKGKISGKFFGRYSLSSWESFLLILFFWKFF